MCLYKIKPATLIIIVSILVYTGFPAAVQAKGNLRIGRLHINPEISYSAEYNDNIYSSDTDEEEDVIHLITPGIKADYTLRPENFIKMGYSVDIARYSENQSNNYEVHRPYILAQLKTPAGAFLKVADSFFKTADPYGDENQYALGIPQTKRWHNNFTFGVGYQFRRALTLEGFYTNFQQNYDHDRDQWQDRTNNGFGTTLLYNITPKTSALLQYKRMQTAYDKQNDGVFGGGRAVAWSSDTSQDYDTDVFYIGTRFAPEGKLTGEIKLGYGYHRFENDMDPAGRPYEDESDFMAETTLKYAIRQRTSINLTLNRYFTGSPDAAANVYIQTNCFLGVMQGIGNRFQTLLQAGWTNLDYIDEPAGQPDKEFNIFQARLGCFWRFTRYMRAGVEYRFKKKNATHSSYPHDEYSRNVVALTISARF